MSFDSSDVLCSKPIQHPDNLMKFTVTPIMMDNAEWQEISRWLAVRGLDHIVERIETIRILILQLNFDRASDAVEFKLRFT